MPRPQTFSKNAMKTGNHAIILGAVKSSRLSEDDYYRFRSDPIKKTTTIPKNIGNPGFDLGDLPDHNWEMSDYDDDHFELLS